ncbi:MAG: agmatinase family protein, partial [Cyclobacteriaceae bacterium]|nr:agmatinase family protein [Cyclobacteriaceae bacterium]
MSNTTYNPSEVGIKGTLFGFPYSEEEAELIVLPVPWDVTVSYGSGTSHGPAAVLDASPQLDTSLYHVAKPWKYRSFMAGAPAGLQEKSLSLRQTAKNIIDRLETGEKPDPNDYQTVNQGCEEMVEIVYQTSRKYLEMGKICAVLGGDHSSPLGLMKALSEKGSFGILQIDAHMDLRKAYEGFTYSHASIMHNALKLPGVSTLVQVGIRDFCEEETDFVHSHKNIHVFYEDQVREGKMIGECWADWVHQILSFLPRNVYVSFDIDGLDPSLCPNTGTPVPGGLAYSEAVFLLQKLVESGRKIVGFDL